MFCFKGQENLYYPTVCIISEIKYQNFSSEEKCSSAMKTLVMEVASSSQGRLSSEQTMAISSLFCTLFYPPKAKECIVGTLETK